MPKSRCTNDKATTPEQSEEVNDLKRSVNFISDKLDDILQSKRNLRDTLTCENIRKHYMPERMKKETFKVV